MYNLEDVGAVFTNCLFPEFTVRAITSIHNFYPRMPAVVVDDHGRDDITELIGHCRIFNIPLLMNEERVGAGYAIDRGVAHLDTPLVLTVDHGVELLQPGLVEVFVEMMASSPYIGVGRIRSDKKCNAAFGPYVDPFFAMWDADFIRQEKLSFKLTNIRVGDWHVDGCSTAQFLQYRAMRLGREPCFLRPALVYSYLRHHKTPHTRGRCQSPHELVTVDEDYLVDRRRKSDGSLAYDRRIS